MRNFVDICNRIIPLIPTNRTTYDLIQAITNLRDKAMFMPPEIIIVSWIELHLSITEVFKPEEFDLRDWEQQIINILIGTE